MLREVASLFRISLSVLSHVEHPLQLNSHTKEMMVVNMLSHQQHNRRRANKTVALIATALAVTASLPAWGADTPKDITTAGTQFIIGQTAMCGDLPGQHFGPATIKSATVVAASAGRPEFCRIVAYKTGKPIFEMVAFLPTRWNGELLHGGQGGFKGNTPTRDAIWNATSPLDQGMAYISGNGGHNDPSGMKLADPEILRDYVYGSLGSVYDFGTAILAAYYKSPPRKAFFFGCSGGGQEALQAAAVYPEHYDAIVAQAPPPNRVAFLARVGDLYARPRISTIQLSSIYKNYVSHCDAADGLADGVVSNPGACAFDPTSAMQWTGPELETIRSVYNDITSKDGKTISRKMGFGFSRVEALTNQAPVWGKTVFATDEVDYDPAKYTLEAYLPKMIAATDRVGFNLDPVAVAGFLKQGKKLMLQQGLDDGSVSPYEVADFAAKVRTAAGNAADNFQVRWFPGVGHCGVSPAADPNDITHSLRGPHHAETLGFMRDWVNTGRAPSTLISARKKADGTVELTRPICLSGSFARYNGRGDSNKAENFTCVTDPHAF